MTPAIHTAPREQQPSSLRLVLVMGVIGLAASVLLVATYRITLPYVEANRQAYLEAAVFDVLPRTASKVTLTNDDGTLVPVVPNRRGGLRLHAGYDETGALTGVAIEAQGQGFQDIVKILIGYDPGCACIVGMKVLESKETPGLGDKIDTDDRFQSNFDALDVRLSSDDLTLLHHVTMVKKGADREPWQIEAITGATISSRAVTDIIDAAVRDVLPLIRRNLDRLQSRPWDADSESEEAR